MVLIPHPSSRTWETADLNSASDQHRHFPHRLQVPSFLLNRWEDWAPVLRFFFASVLQQASAHQRASIQQAVCGHLPVYPPIASLISMEASTTNPPSSTKLSCPPASSSHQDRGRNSPLQINGFPPATISTLHQFNTYHHFPQLPVQATTGLSLDSF